MEKKTDSILNKKLISATGWGMLLVSFFVMMYRSAIINPDSDAYWLVTTGRYIVENHRFPKINPWVSGGDYKIVVQQPICSILNYIWYSFSNQFGSLWQLATIMNAIMIMSMLYLAKKMKYSKFAILFGLSIAELYGMVANINNTRPFQITIAMSCILIANLEVAKSRKSYKRAIGTVALVSIWQANYQMASLIAIPLFISCYTVGGLCNKVCIYIKERNRKIFKRTDFLKGISLYVIWGISSLVNPYGIDGVLYLYHSREAMRICRNFINELLPYDFFSVPTFFIIGVFIGFIIVNGKSLSQCFEKSFLVCGCVLAALMANRNFWMVIVATIFVFPELINFIWKRMDNKTYYLTKSLGNTEKKRILFYLQTATIFSILISIILTINIQSRFDDQTHVYISEIEKIPEDATIFTNFATGAIVEYAGKKAYIDARPELFAIDINGCEDRLSEWIELYYGNPDILEQYMQTHIYDYYVIQLYDVVYNYFAETNSGQVVYVDYVTGQCIVKRVNK